MVQAVRVWLALLLASGLICLTGCSDSSEVLPQPPAPTIVAQPADTQVTQGGTALFSVAAAGTDLGYQWQRSNDAGSTWAALAGATAAAFSLPNVTLGDSGAKFRVVISRSGAQATSSAVTLTVAAQVQPVAITVQPTAQQATEGGSASFAVTATGTALTYQWQSSNNGSTWTDITGATLPTLQLTAVPIASNGLLYRVVVRNTLGALTTQAVALMVLPMPAAPAFSTQPAATSVTAPAAATFTVAATGTPAPGLQWQRSSDNGATYADIAGATHSSYTTPATTLADNGALLRVRATNTVGSALSNAATLSVSPALAAPTVQQQPQDTSITLPQSATFTVAASGNPQPTYQWQISSDGGITFANINGAAQASYTATPVLADNGRSLRVVVSNSQGSVNSRAAVLSVAAAPGAPTIQQQPQDATVTPPQSVTFTVVASANPAPGYQWQVSTDGINFTDISGATQASFSGTPLLQESGRTLRVVVSNALGSVVSRAALLTVVGAPSNLTGRAWTAGQQMEAGDGVMPGLMASGIDDQGRVTSVFAKQDSGRIALFAVRGTPGAAGVAPSYGTPVIIDAQAPFDWRNGVTLAVSPGGNALAGWQVQAACSATTYNTTGACTYWVVARYMAATGVWEAPAVVGDMPTAPYFDASINDAGDIAGTGSSWARNSDGSVDAIAIAAYWRAAGQTAFSRRAFTTTDINDANIPGKLTLDANGNFVISGRGRQGLVFTYDLVAYRGTVRTGVGAREVVDLRGADVTNVLHIANPGGQVALVWNQNNGVQATTYVAYLDSPTGTWSVTDIGVTPQTSNIAMTLTDSGDVIRYAWSNCSVTRRTAGVWGAQTFLPAGMCVGAPTFAVARNGNVLAVQTAGSTGRWLSYDADRGDVISAYTSALTGSGYVLGVGVLPAGTLLLANNGIGAYVSTNVYDVLPTAAAPSGDSRGVISLWGVIFK